MDRLLDEAMALSPNERQAFLAGVTGSDEELRREVESLLNAHERAEGNFLDSPALEIAARDLAVRREDSWIGKRFGIYQIISVLGVGGMGEVYLARDERLGRRLALKILPAQFVTDAARVDRFAREARAVAALNHPNIVTVYDVGAHEETRFIAMEYVDGQTLRDKLTALRSGRYEEKEVVDIALQIASALAAAHTAGIVHRDIKPENVMMRRDDFIKVLDFGLAKLAETPVTPARLRGEATDLAVTRPGTVLGTVRYMSPEQALGQMVDARSDLFSLGIVLYELFTGSPPFKGDRPAAVLDAIVHHKPLPLRQACAAVSEDSERIVSRLLEKDRGLRYQTAEDLRAELKQLKRALYSSSSYLLDSGSADHRAAITPNRRWRRRWLAATLAVLLVACAAFAWRRWGMNFTSVPSPWLAAYNTRLTDSPGEERDPALSPDGKVVYFARQVQGQWDVFRQRVGGSKATNLTEGNNSDETEPACSPDGATLVFRSERNGGGLFLMGATGENVRQLVGFGHDPAWSPDGKQIVCGTAHILDPRWRTGRSRLAIINVVDGQTRDLLTDGDYTQPHWSPSGNRIAYCNAENKGDVWTMAADGSAPHPVLSDEATDWNPRWSSDGRYLHFNSNRKGFASLWRVRIDEATGRRLGEPEPVTSPTTDIVQADVARTGRSIVYSERVLDLTLKALDFDPVKPATSGKMTTVTESTRPASWPTFSADGQWVAYHTMLSGREDIWLTRADGSSAPTNLTNDATLDRCPAWSPTGRRLAYFSRSNGISRIWLVNADGSDSHPVTQGPVGCVFPFWAPDGRLAFSLSTSDDSNPHQRGTRIIEPDKPWEQQTPVALPAVDENSWFNGHSWSPDGQRIAGEVVTFNNKEARTVPGIFVYSFATNRYEQVTDFGTYPAWLNDNRRLVFTYSGKGKLAGNELWVVDLPTKFTKPVYYDATHTVTTFALTRENRRLVLSLLAFRSDLSLLSLDR